MKKIVYVIIAIIIISCNQQISTDQKHESTSEFKNLEDNTIMNLYDAFGEDKENLIKDFGFSCLIKYNGKTILFDGGTNADIFKNNVEELNIDLSKVDFVVASHSHFDHINGFDYLMKVNPNVKIYFPFDLFWGANIPFNLTGTDSTIIDSLDKRMQYFEGNFKDYQLKQTGRFWNANIEFINENTEIEPGVKLIATTSPYMGYFNKYPNLEPCEDCDSSTTNFNELQELSLSLESDEGEIIFVGCSHSMVEKIISETKEYSNNEVEMVYGGYHLLPYDRKTLLNLTSRLKNDLKVKKVAPAHCTGHLAFKLLQDAFKEDYVFAGLGEIVKF